MRRDRRAAAAVLADAGWSASEIAYTLRCSAGKSALCRPGVYGETEVLAEDILHAAYALDVHHSRIGSTQRRNHVAGVTAHLEGASLADLAEVWGVGKARVCQILARIALHATRLANEGGTSTAAPRKLDMIVEKAGSNDWLYLDMGIVKPPPRRPET